MSLVNPNGLKSHWAEILVARRVQQVGGEPSCLKLIIAEETEMPRSRSTAIQSERTRRRSPRALTSPASVNAPPNSSNFSVTSSCGRLMRAQGAHPSALAFAEQRAVAGKRSRGTGAGGHMMGARRLANGPAGYNAEGRSHGPDS